jgi:hypothetical protein
LDWGLGKRRGEYKGGRTTEVTDILNYALLNLEKLVTQELIQLGLEKQTILMFFMLGRFLNLQTARI